MTLAEKEPEAFAPPSVQPKPLDVEADRNIDFEWTHCCSCFAEFKSHHQVNVDGGDGAMKEQTYSRHTMQITITNSTLTFYVLDCGHIFCIHCLQMDGK